MRAKELLHPSFQQVLRRELGALEVRASLSPATQTLDVRAKCEHGIWRQVALPSGLVRNVGPLLDRLFGELRCDPG